MADAPSLARDMPAAPLESVRRILKGRILWCPLPSPFDHLFALRRQEEFALLARLGWPLLALMIAIISAGSLLMLRPELHGADAGYWWPGLALETLTLAVVVGLLQQPRLLPYYQRVVVLGGAFNLAIPLMGTMIMSSPRLIQVTSYLCLLIINIQILALRLSLPAAALCVVNGTVLGLVFGLWWGGRPDWIMLTWLFGGSLAVTLFISAILERQERISFLQGVLLQHEGRERERLNRELERLVHQDALSGLANRRHFDAMINREWDRLRREERPLALLFIDVDHFKLFNDTYGHGRGDDCLAAVAGVLADAVRRPGDLAARYGGEEFVVLLPDTELGGARDVAERILAGVDALGITHAASDVCDHVTISIGVAVQVPDGASSALSLLHLADAALYAAKNAGRHRIVNAAPQESGTPLPS